MDYDAIIFDQDGVLVTPTDPRLWRTASRLALQDLGALDVDDDHLDLLGGYPLSTLVRVCDSYGVDPGEFWRRRECYAARAQRHAIRVGRKDCYDDTAVLESLSPALGIVSNNTQATVDFAVSHFGFAEAVGPCYGREPSLDGLVRTKPNSHYLCRAIDDIGAVNPLYVGDSSVDVAAAADLGIDSAFLRRSHRVGYDPTPTPTHELDSLADLVRLCATPTVTVGPPVNSVTEVSGGRYS